MKSSLAPDSRNLLVRLEKSINRLSWTIISVGLLMAGITVREGGELPWVSNVLIVVSILALGWGIVGQPTQVTWGILQDKITQQKLKFVNSKISSHEG